MGRTASDHGFVRLEQGNQLIVAGSLELPQVVPTLVRSAERVRRPNVGPDVTWCSRLTQGNRVVHHAAAVRHVTSVVRIESTVDDAVSKEALRHLACPTIPLQDCPSADAGLIGRCCPSGSQLVDVHRVSLRLHKGDREPVGWSALHRRQRFVVAKTDPRALTKSAPGRRGGIGAELALRMRRPEEESDVR